VRGYGLTFMGVGAMEHLSRDFQAIPGVRASQPALFIGKFGSLAKVPRTAGVPPAAGLSRPSP